MGEIDVGTFDVTWLVGMLLVSVEEFWGSCKPLSFHFLVAY